eukprot:m.454065 g.454065  ORF g.454065 m.454065 type:complete len:297 (+) comp21563_c0_seq3:114-1004(+)
MSRKVGQGLSRFAGRYPLSTTSIYPTVKSKSSDNIHRLQDAISEKVSSVYSAGLACSEVFSGPRLSSVLQDAHQLERRALACMHNDKPAPPLAVHTSGGVVPQLDSFATELRHHLPWDPDADDWFFNLQVEGTSAVLAACDTLMQLSHQKEGNRQRVKIGVASSSYHGPPVSTFGSRAVGPLGMGHAQVVYPAPTIWARCHAAETHGIHADDAFDEYMRNRFTAFLAEYGYVVRQSNPLKAPWNRIGVERSVNMRRNTASTPVSGETQPYRCGPLNPVSLCAIHPCTQGYYRRSSH